MLRHGFALLFAGGSGRCRLPYAAAPLPPVVGTPIRVRPTPGGCRAWSARMARSTPTRRKVLRGEDTPAPPRAGRRELAQDSSRQLGRRHARLLIALRGANLREGELASAALGSVASGCGTISP